MSYGAYGMKMNPNYGVRVNPSTGFSTGSSSNDILYNLGGLLGAIWANNYNQRGIQKGTAEGQNAISDVLKTYAEGRGQTDDQVGVFQGGNVTVDGQQVALPGGAQQIAKTNGTYESAGNIGAGANGVNLGQGITAAPQSGAISSMDFIQPQSTAISATGSIPQQYQPQNLTVNGQQVPSANFSQPQPQTTPSSDASANGQGVVVPAAEAPRDLKAEKQDYVVQKYSDTDNPEEDKRAITATALAAKGQIANANLSNIPLSKESLSAIARSEMLKNGRTPYQIEQVMKIIEPDIANKVEQNNAQQFNALYDLYKQQVQSGQIDASALTYARMRQLNPTLAEGLSGQFKRNQGDFLEQYKYDQSVKMLMKNRGYSEQEAKNFLETGDTRYSQKDLQNMGYIAGKAPSYGYGGGGSRGSRDGGGGYGGGKSRSVAGGGSTSKGPAWDKRIEWARSVLENPNASPELKQSATNVLRAYDRYMAGDNYVVPISVVKAELQKAIGNGELTYDEARNWIYFDSGLGEDEQRIVDKWFRDTYGDLENPDSEGGREEFDAVLSNNTSTSTPEPEEVPNANGHTGILASLEALGEAWDNFKLEDVANWVKNH